MKQGNYTVEKVQKINNIGSPVTPQRLCHRLSTAILSRPTKRLCHGVDTAKMSHRGCSYMSGCLTFSVKEN